MTVRLDVFLAPSELTPTALERRVVAVIDVLRATTTIAAALHAGARTVIPFLTTEDAMRTAKRYERGEVKLAGERQMVAIPGFELGNSPLEFTTASVGGQTVLLTTTNGTRALLAAEDARAVYIASYGNFSLVRTQLLQALQDGHSVSIVCAASEGMPSLEDSACAGRFVHSLVDAHAGLMMNDAARMCALLSERYGDDLLALCADAEHGRRLSDAGFAADVMACATLDLYPVLGELVERAIVRVSTPQAASSTSA
ncbi:MAG: 2-phosphosulfolactate phosphatase [Gemmatimonadaceae bacterium]|nr:2-phosphosulfolactate phosphatase [Gemmatimonadaceae bacterium]